jgi:uncharacterized protein YjiS (DUF1127 family)
MRAALLMHSQLRRLIRQLGRLAAAHREMTMLLRADERALKDIGLTAGDARAAASCGRMARAAANRRNEAIAAARQRKGRTVSGAASRYSNVA